MTEDNGPEAIDEILAFWFAEGTKPHWYASTPDFDLLCRTRFGDLTAKAAAGELDTWEGSAEGALALCLLLDQMPRNLFRGSAKAFESDPKAIAVASRAIQRGFDLALERERRKFLYLPFMHSEGLAEQERSVELSERLEDPETLRYAIEHAEIIRRFGRFPHRNPILGRTSTAEEKAFLADGAKTYGQSPADPD